MKTRYAATLSGLSLLIAGIFTATTMYKGLRIATVLLPKQVWIADNPGLWTLGCWLWMLAIFGWMVLLVTLTWSYLPGHRVSSMLQSGLMVISAVLAIAALVVWMTLSPYAAARPDEAFYMLPFVDTLALGLAGAGFFMGGAVTAWIGWDLAQLDMLNWAWGGPPAAAGLLAVPAPFVLPMPWLLAAAGVIWLAWCLFLITRRELPNAFSEWS